MSDDRQARAEWADDIEELEALLAALVLFAPQGTDPFGRAVLRAGEVLHERGVRLSPNDLRQWVDRWPPVR